MNPINVKSIVKDHKPSSEPSKNVAGWFKSETIELNFGEYTGRPSANVIMHSSYISKFLENGWTIDAVSASEEDGRWETVRTTDHKANTVSEDSSSSYTQSLNDSRDTTSSVSETNSNNSSRQHSSTNSSSSERQTESSSSNGSSSSSGSNTNSNSTTSRSGSSSSSTSTAGSSDSNSTSSSDSTKTSSSANGSESSSSDTKSEDNEYSNTERSEGDAYWCAYNRIRFKRVRMQPSLVLQSMVSSFTNAYNSGRTIENDRYNEMISLYAVAMSNTESECNDLLSGAMNLTPLFNKLCESVLSSISSGENASASIRNYVLADAENDIEREFSNAESKAKTQMVANGTYNTTVWATVVAGFARQKAAALAKAKSEGLQIVASAMTNAASVRANISSGLMAAAQAMSDSADRRKMTATEARNAIVKWIVDFAGQREEVYPELQEISTLTERLGFSVGSAGNVL